MTNNQKLSSLTINKAPEEMFLVLGQIKDSELGFNIISDGVFAKRIPDKEKCVIAKNNIWQSGKIYNEVGSQENYYVLNNNNNVVYLCISNNANNNNQDVINMSVVIPNHTTPTINQLSDGYSWLPLYRVDSSQLNFITNKDLPTAKIFVEKEYSSFFEKYKPLCGSGVTSFGCCCLYFKESNIDEITNEVYTKGSITNETIFSTCYECQKLADSLKREVLFLDGLTAGSVENSNNDKNYLCPSTKYIKEILEEFEDNKYNTIPNSSNAFSYGLLNNFNNFSGIMFARINTNDITESEKIISTPNPLVNIVDTTGSGAVVRLKTIQISTNNHKVIGIEIISRGSGYSKLPDFYVDGISENNIINSIISIGVFPESIFISSDEYVYPISYKIKTSIITDELSSMISSANIDSYTILTNPDYTDNNSKIISTKNNSDYFSLETRVICGLSGEQISIVNQQQLVDNSLSGGGSNPNFKSNIVSGFSLLTVRNNNGVYINNISKNNYQVFSSGVQTTSNGVIKFKPDSINTYSIPGVIAFTTDTNDSVIKDDILKIQVGSTTKYYNVLGVELSPLKKDSGKSVSSGLLSNNITNKTNEITKSYAFTINIDTIE